MSYEVIIRFPDGGLIAAPSATEALKTWREKQWHDTDEAGFREELAKRAYIWSSAIINIKVDAIDLLHQLATAGLIKVEEVN